MAVDAQSFRAVMASFVTGVTVITVRHDGEVRAMTANAFSALSLTPPLVLVCVLTSGATNTLLRKAGHFAVNILRADQQHLANRFAGRSPDDRHYFADMAVREGVTGSAIFTTGLAYADCRIADIHEGGDHTIFIGEVLDCRVLDEGRPLAYFRRRYRDLAVEEGQLLPDYLGPL
jgi:flavin reductase (DIM6/NTAB) family NADH-FMN oxidoreductase RutF